MRKTLLAFAALIAASAATAQVIVTVPYRPPETVQRVAIRLPLRCCSTDDTFSGDSHLCRPRPAGV
mgnify:CR=1 FL=1